MTASVKKKAHVWARDEFDWYVEPKAATRQLLAVERFVGPVHDPCCGMGDIPTALKEHGYIAIGTDIVDRTCSPEIWWKGIEDFTAENTKARAPNICMNPPFFRAKGAERFIRTALERATGKVCVFLDIRFICGASRALGLYADTPPNRIWMITPRVSCPPGQYLLDGGKAGNGSSDWCWMIWDRSAPFSGTMTGWLTRAHLPEM